MAQPLGLRRPQRRPVLIVVPAAGCECRVLADLEGVDRMNLPQRDSGRISGVRVALVIAGQVRGVEKKVACPRRGAVVWDHLSTMPVQEGVVWVPDQRGDVLVCSGERKTVLYVLGQCITGQHHLANLIF